MNPSRDHSLTAYPHKGIGPLGEYGVARFTVQGTALNTEELRKVHALWRARNYLTLGMIYL